jgi:NAD(P)H dehydrogenase (quinone)
MTDLAAIVSATIGREIGYTDLPPAEYRAALTAAGVPDTFAELLADADINIANGWLDAPSAPLEQLIGRPPTPLAAAIQAALASRP